MREVPTDVENEQAAPAATHLEHGFSFPHWTVSMGEIGRWSAYFDLADSGSSACTHDSDSPTTVTRSQKPYSSIVDSAGLITRWLRFGHGNASTECRNLQCATWMATISRM